jgi:hypothetical protein
MNDERLSIPGVVLGSELGNLDTLHDIETNNRQPLIEGHKPADVGTAARWRGERLQKMDT